MKTDFYHLYKDDFLRKLLDIKILKDGWLIILSIGYYALGEH